MIKKILIAAFIDKDDKANFMTYLNDSFGVPENEVFVFDIIDDEKQFLCTFHIIMDLGERIEIKEYFDSAIIIHKKKTTFYTINALNKLIEIENKLDKGNIDYKRYRINWDNYKNKILLTNNNNLVLIRLKRVF